MRYWPPPSLTAVRTFSINAGLDASTVTPGSTAPDVSFTTPVIDCAAAGDGTIATRATAANHHRLCRVTQPVICHLSSLRIRSDVHSTSTCLSMPEVAGRQPSTQPSRQRVDARQTAVHVRNERSAATVPVNVPRRHPAARVFSGWVSDEFGDQVY